MTTRDEVAEWIDRYETAWRTAGTGALSGLFTADAHYRMSPYEETLTGLEEIGAMWEREREGPDEGFTMSTETVALDGDVAVVRVEVHYDGPPAREYRDLWIVRFGDDGRCVQFEEWPFYPGQPVSSRSQISP
jgi:ketosteroid isomerase-like protein